MRTFVTPIEEARKLGAMMLFGEKYGERGARRRDRRLLARALRRDARPLDSGDRAVRDPPRSSVGSGARRIEAVTAGEAWAFLHGRSRELDATRTELEQARREAKKPKQAAQAADVEPEIVVVGGINVIVMEVPRLGADALLDLSDRFKQRSAPAAVVLGSREDGPCISSRTSTRASPSGSRPATSSRRSRRSSAGAAAAVRRWRAPAARSRRSSPTRLPAPAS